MHRSNLLVLGTLLMATMAAGCSGDHLPMQASVPEGAPAADVLAVLDCALSVSEGLTCGPSRSGVLGPARGDIILGKGGNGDGVRLTNTPPVLAAGIMSIDVAVKNLIPQSLATKDGSVYEPAGVRVLFISGPSNGATLANNDGTGYFVSGFPNNPQPFYEYALYSLGGDGLLTQNETSAAKTWQFSMNGATSTAFRVLVSAPIMNENGSIQVNPANATLTPGSTFQLTATVLDAKGNPVGIYPTPQWTSTDPSVASVNQNGLVTVNGNNGYAIIGVTSGVPSQFTAGWAVVSVGVAVPPPGGTAEVFRYSIGGEFRLQCSNFTLQQVVGTGYYADISDICSAAVHAGKISFPQGGNVTIRVAPGQLSYGGSTLNGVTSSSSGSQPGSFIFP